jgi:hypothetical protein
MLLNDRKTMFTTGAKGGASSGQICPHRTIPFNTSKQISKTILLMSPPPYKGVY